MRLNPVYATEEQANRLYFGVYEKDYSEWYSLNGNHYTPIGTACGIERKRNNLYFHNFVDSNIYLIRFIEFTTLDEKEYFIRIVMDVEEIFIPIKER